MPSQQKSWWALSLLLLVYILNQWDRYSLVYLSGVAVSECPNKNVSDACYLEGNEFGTPHKAPLCAADRYTCPEGDAKCAECQACLDSNRGAYLNLKYGACVSETEYALLASYGFVLLFSISGLVAGQVSDRANRVAVITVALIGWSACVIGQGLSQSFSELLVSRVLLGIFQAFSAPASYSLIADIFPVESRGKANGIYSFGVYVGGGLGSLSIVMAHGVGWRNTSFMCGLLGVLVALALFSSVPEPARENQSAGGSLEAGTEDSGSTEGRAREGSVLEEVLNSMEHDEAEQEAPAMQVRNRRGTSPEPPARGSTTAPRASETVTMTFRAILCDKAVLLLYTAGALRFIGGMTIGTFLPEYFRRQYPDYNSQYSVFNAGVVSVGGAVSSYMGGYIADKWSQRDDRARVWVPAIGCVTGFVPFVGLLLANNFYVSIALLLAEYLFAEVWFAGALSVLQNRVASHRVGTAISGYLFAASILGNAAPAIIGVIDDGATASSLRTVLGWAVGISYFSAAIAFLACGQAMRNTPKYSAASTSEVEQPLLSDD